MNSVEQGPDRSSVTGVFELELSAEVTIQIVVGVSASDVVLPPPRPRPVARMVAVVPLDMDALQTLDISVSRIERT